MIRIRSTRAEDEALLEMLAMRRRTPSAAVGAFFGTTGVAVRVATDRVVKDDSAEEGRDVRAEYGFLSQEKAQRAGYNAR